MSTLITHIKRLALALCLATPFVSWADYPTSDIISLNISNDDQYMMTGEGETETLVGLLPDNAWKNTKQTDRTGVWHSGDTRNGYSNGVTAWDGASQQVTTLGNVVFSWAVEGDGTANYGNVDAPNNPVFHKAWLARKNASATKASILLQNIPYEKYDVIVYCFGSDDTAFKPVSVNGVYYVGDRTLETDTNTRLATSSSETWGGRRATPSLGQSVIRVNGLANPELHLSYNSGTTGICAVQIVRDMSAIGEETLAAGKVISVNLQSSYNTNGFRPDSYGLVRVPSSAWTDDGLSNASSSGTDVSAAIKEWNGSTKTSYAISGISINEKAANAWRAYKYYNDYGEYIPIANLINSYLDDGGNRALVTVTGVPYKQYDVIVYTATDSSGNQFGPVTVNGTPYRWNGEETVEVGSADSTADTRWGASLLPIPAYGVNALRITGQTAETLTIKGANNANTARGGIAGFQIVDTYVPPPMVVDPDGTIVISESPTEEKRVVCEGSLTVTGTETYTVTSADLRAFDFTGVAGTVTLGAYTIYPIGSDRALPAAFAFGEGSTIEITETRAEFLADLFTVSGLTGVSYVKMTRADGTIESLDVVDGVVTFGSGNGTTKIDGVATMYDLTFANNEADVGKSGYHTNQGTFTYTCGVGELNYDRAATFNNDAWDDTTGLYLRCSPYIDLAASAFNALGDFTTVVVGQMSPSPNTIFLHLGSCNGGNGLLIATTENQNEVIIAKNSSQTVDVANSVKAKVPNAATARHAYAIVKRGSTFAVWVDGVRRGIIDVGNDFKLGTSSHAGLQVGSHFGGDGLGATWKKVADSQTETGVVNVIRVFDYAISDAQAEAVFATYPYESEGGLYKRTVDGDANFSAEGAWSDSDENTYDAPVSATEGYNPSATITVESASKLTVNAAVILDKLTIGGTAALTLDGDNAITVADSAIINSPLVVTYGALDLAGTPVQLGSAGSITFDCSAIDVSSIYKTTHYQLTGLVDRDDSKVIVTEPAGDAYRTVATVYNENGFYELVVTPDHEAGSDVYYAGGYVGTTENTFSVTNASGKATIVFPGDSVVVPAYHNGSSAYFGSTLPDNISAIRVEKDFSFEPGVSEPVLSGVTVAVSEGKKLTFGATWHGLDLGAVTLNGPGVVEFDGSKAGNATDKAAGTFKVSGAVAGTSTLTIAAGKAVTVESTGSIANAIVLKAGASLTVDANASVTEPTTDVEGHSVKPTDNGESTVYSVVEDCSIEVILDQGVAEPNGTATIKVGETNLESGDTVPAGTTVTVAVTPAEGFKINEVEVTMGGLDITESIETEETGNVTTATLEITDDTTIAITFAIKAVSFTVEAVANTTVKVMEGASEVTPENDVYSVNAGAQVKVIWEAVDGYIVTGGETDWFTPTASQQVTSPEAIEVVQAEACVVRMFASPVLYPTVQAAIDSDVNVEVKLLKDIDTTTTVLTIGALKNVVLDLNGNSIKGGNNGDITVLGNFTLKDTSLNSTGRIYSSVDYGAGHTTGLIVVKENGQFNMSSGEIYAVREDTVNKGHYGVIVADNGSVTINGGKITAGWYAVGANNTTGSAMTVNISGGMLVSTMDYALYVVGNMAVTLSDFANVSGAAGMAAVRNGSLTVTGGTFSTDGTGDVGVWKDGTGTIIPSLALINIPANYGVSTVSISGGSFESTGANPSPVFSFPSSALEGSSVSISGGTFSSAIPDEFCASGYIPCEVTGGYSVKQGSYAAEVKETGAKFETLADAVAAAEVGQTVKLLKQYMGSYTLNKAITIDSSAFSMSPTIAADGGYVITMETNMLGADTWFDSYVDETATPKIAKYGYGATHQVTFEVSAYGTAEIVTGYTVLPPDYYYEYYRVKDGTQLKVQINSVIEGYVPSGSTITVGEVTTPLAAPVAGAYTVTITANAKIKIDFARAGIDPTKPESTQEVVIDPVGKTDEQIKEAAIAAATVTVPEGEVANTGVDADTYKEYFNYTVTDKGNGVYEVALNPDNDLNETIVLPEEVTVGEETIIQSEELLEAATNAEIEEAEVPAVPGIYYSMVAADNLGFADAVEGDQTLATGRTVTIAKPTQLPSGNAVFFRVKASATPNN